MSIVISLILIGMIVIFFIFPVLGKLYEYVADFSNYNGDNKTQFYILIAFVIFLINVLLICMGLIIYEGLGTMYGS